MVRGSPPVLLDNRLFCIIADMPFVQYEPRYVFSYSGSAEGFFNPTLHKHDAWQLELVMKGKANVLAGDDIRLAQEGDSIVIPARVPHSFRCRDARTRCASVLFSLQSVSRTRQIVCLRQTRPLAALRSGIATLLRDNPRIGAVEQKVLEHLLKGFVFFYFESLDGYNGRASAHDVSVVKGAKQYIHRHAHLPLTVHEVAGHLGYSENHLSNLFRRLENMSTKRYIDLTRTELIKQHLSYSDRSISEIADEFGFKDLYSFSRYFKRTTRVCPRAFRRMDRIPL